jgi:lipid A ethanolaminephosphotransferase
MKNLNTSFLPLRSERFRSFIHSPLALTLLVSLFFVVFGNQAFWRVVQRADGSIVTLTNGFMVSLFIVVLIGVNLLLTLTAFRFVFKPLLISLLLASAAVAYFMDQFGVMVDMPMVKNVVETNISEVQDLLSARLLLYVLLLGVVPSVIVYFYRVEYPPLRKNFLRNSAVIAVSLLTVAGINSIYPTEYKALLKHQRNVRYVINPISYVASVEKYLQVQAHARVMQPIGEDAMLVAGNDSNRKPKLLVIVVGETARAQDFSLNGYNRNTNPLLSKDKVINFTNVSSCGTATAISVPCMFSHMDHDHYDGSQVNDYENLLDVLNRAGVKVFWRDNNHGCKDVCNRVETEEMPHYHLDSYCKDRECVDEILLYKLQERISDSGQDMVIVLHQLGSHGPAYYKRYPDEFRQFQPTCDTNQLTQCTYEQIRNTYDNTVLYTDFVLDRVIGLLKSNSAKFNTAMMYVSDHGESLGEDGQYLHGTPYALAPETQTHVPFITWISPELSSSARLDTACLRSNTAKPYSHDNLFHSVLGLMNVSTRDYDASRDIFAGCRPEPVRMMAGKPGSDQSSNL